MSNPEKPQQPAFDTSKLQETVEDIRTRGAEALRNPSVPEVQQAKGFVERNKKVIVGGIVLVVAVKVNRRKTAKAVSKAVAKALNEVQPTSEAPETMGEILQWLKATPGMGYIGRGSKWVHLLGVNDIVITIFGDFDKMNDTEVWKYAAQKLAGQ